MSTKNLTREEYTGVRLTMKSLQSFEETHSKLMTALHGEAFKPGDVGRESGPILAKADKEAFEEFINSKCGPYGFMYVWLSSLDCFNHTLS